MKTTKIILGLALAFSIFSCSKDESNSSSELSEAKVSAKIDMATEDVAKIVEDQ